MSGKNEALKKLYDRNCNGRILVIVTEDKCGFVTIRPVNTRYYDDDYVIFLQSYDDIHSFLDNYPKARFRVPSNQYGEGYKIGRYTYEVNGGVKFYIDSWDFRHMVGGQSD